MAVRGLTDLVALLNGATSGVGLEAAAQLAEAGVPQIVISGRDPDAGERAVRQIRERAPQAQVVFRAADTSDPEQAKRLVESTVSLFERVDVLVNSASGTALTPRLFDEIDLREVAQVFDVYFWTAFNCCHAAYPGMRAQGGGSIVNFSSESAKHPTPGETLHGAALAATLMFTRTLSLEASRHGIRVNCITPSVISGTKSWALGMKDDFSRRLFSKAASRAHLGVVEAHNVAPLVVFLAGPASSHLTGQAISVNGGISAA